MLIDTLLTRFRGRRHSPEPCPDDHVEAAARAAEPARCDEITRPAPKPPEASPRREPVAPPATVAPRRPLAPVGGPRPGKLAALTPVLGRRKAGQALWAPHLLTRAEREQAERILKEFH